MNKVLDFWMKIWLYAMAVGCIILIVLLSINWNQFDWATRLAYFSVITLPFHVWEEWRFPAGFHYIYNLVWKSATPDRYPMNRVSDMVTNFGALIIFSGGLILIGIGALPTPIVVIALFFFCVMEVFAHTGIGLLAYKTFKAKGKKTIYNPGQGTSYLMFLPTGIGFLYIFATGLYATVLSDWVWGGALAIGIFFLLIPLPERLLRNKNTPYPFTGKYQYGYFKKFIDASK